MNTTAWVMDYISTSHPPAPPPAKLQPIQPVLKTSSCSTAGKSSQSSRAASHTLRSRRPTNKSTTTSSNPPRTGLSITPASHQLTEAADSTNLRDQKRRATNPRIGRPHPTTTAHHASGYAPRGRVRRRPVQGEMNSLSSRMRYTGCSSWSSLRQWQPDSNLSRPHRERGGWELDGWIVGRTDEGLSAGRAWDGNGRAGRAPFLWLRSQCERASRRRWRFR